MHPNFEVKYQFSQFASSNFAEKITFLGSFFPTLTAFMVSFENHYSNLQDARIEW